MTDKVTLGFPPSSITVHEIPKEFWSCHLHNFDFGERRELLTEVTEFVAEENLGRHLILTGPPGLGKTHLSVGIFRAFVAEHGTGTCGWFDIPDSALLVKQRYDDKSVKDVIGRMEECRHLVVMDDVFGRKATAHDLDYTIYPFIHTVHANQASLVMTTNYSMEQLEEVLAQHELDRLLERCRIFGFKGDSRRKGADD
jgi:DNA replication protein DnaC